MTSAELNPELRKLIDARLEAIDRVLSSTQIAWSERRSIVDEVETQIFELLARRSPTPTQEDLLAILASLDPPEAYIREEQNAPAVDALPAGAPPRAPWRELPGEAVRLVVRWIPAATTAVVLVIVNGVAIGVIAASEGVFPWMFTLAGLGWLNYAAVRRYRAWSAARQGSLLDDLRHSLAAWLLSKNGAQAT